MYRIGVFHSFGSFGISSVYRVFWSFTIDTPFVICVLMFFGSSGLFTNGLLRVVISPIR